MRTTERSALHETTYFLTSTLETVLESVIDEQSFLRFLQALAEDWNDEQEQALTNPSSPYGAGANGWKNGTIVVYLDAAASWGKASVGGLDSAKSPTTHGGDLQRFFTWKNFTSSLYGPPVAHCNVRWNPRSEADATIPSLSARTGCSICLPSLRENEND